MPVGQAMTKAKKAHKVIYHKIFAASSAISGATLYKGSKDFGVAANATESTGGLNAVQGLDPNKHYRITRIYVVLGTAPSASKTCTCTLRINAADSTDGVVTISGTDTTGYTTLQDILTYDDYVSMKFVGTATASATTIKAYLTIEEV